MSRLDGVKNDNIFRINSEFLDPAGRHVEGPSNLIQNGLKKKCNFNVIWLFQFRRNESIGRGEKWQNFSKWMRVLERGAWTSPCSKAFGCDPKRVGEKNSFSTRSSYSNPAEINRSDGVEKWQNFFKLKAGLTLTVGGVSHVTGRSDQIPYG